MGVVHITVHAFMLHQRRPSRQPERHLHCGFFYQPEAAGEHGEMCLWPSIAR